MSEEKSLEELLEVPPSGQKRPLGSLHGGEHAELLGREGKRQYSVRSAHVGPCSHLPAVPTHEAVS